GADDADREPLLEQNRALLDMYLEIPDEMIATARERGDLCRIEPRLCHRSRQAHAVGIAPLEQLGVEPSRDGAAAEEARREPYALFFRECNHVEMEWQLAVQPTEMLGKDEGDEHTKAPVVSAGVADGVVMRGENQRRRGTLGGGIAPDHICNRVDLGGESRLAH